MPSTLTCMVCVAGDLDEDAGIGGAGKEQDKRGQGACAKNARHRKPSKASPPTFRLRWPVPLVKQTTARQLIAPFRNDLAPVRQCGQGAIEASHESAKRLG